MWIADKAAKRVAKMSAHATKSMMKRIFRSKAHITTGKPL